ncbi:MAG TPA: hypothetical protein VGH87_24590 [Polyangiaceae bacterium]|jgi:hypothetical protein|nr:hypothetical protein [Polyangiaceae bacterium]
MASCGSPPPATSAKCPENKPILTEAKAAVAPPFVITFAPSLDPAELRVHVKAHSAGRAPVDLEYVLPAAPVGDVVVSNAGFVRFYGEALKIPSWPEKTHVVIDFDLTKAPVENVASSFGNGKHVEIDIAPSELTKGVWMAGSVFTASFDAYEGVDHFSWIGYSAFDPRWVAAEIATLRTAVGQWFGDKNDPNHPVPFSMLFTADRRSAVESSPISIYPRWHGVFGVVDIDAPWSVAARMQVALALVPRFLSKPGYARYAAREILLASGTMTPAEYEQEVNGEIAATLFADKSPAAAAIAKDALDCNRTDARTMQKMLRDLATTGKMETPSGETSFGKCFARTSMKFDELDLGFDEARTRAAKALVGVHGAAQKAGLREGEALVSIRWDEGNTQKPVRVVVSRDGKDTEVKYRPIGRSKTAPGWHLVSGVDLATCAR